MVNKDYHWPTLALSPTVRTRLVADRIS